MPNTLNLTVHVQIYYYMRSTAGVRIWWKQYLTTLEIVYYLLLFINFCRLTYNEKAKATKQQWQHCGTDMTPKPVNSGSSGSKKSKSNLTEPMSQKMS
ncbi:hypothetical protein BGZ90_001549 [Linnemannia elongata]|nr:hypothetical protein BGZ90_001549 [Linnemannia elongata]